ncbi:MAG: hypothetical protein ABIH41_03180 [Nanoarchaeota archaeon]
MASIPSVVYMLIGAVMVGVSLWVQDKTAGKSNLVIFVVIGAIFFLVGIVKMIFGFMGQSKKRKAPQASVRPQQSPLQAPPQAGSQTAPQKAQARPPPPQVTCPHCGKKQFYVSKFCSYCHRQLHR